jgi:hypothetical protein
MSSLVRHFIPALAVLAVAAVPAAAQTAPPADPNLGNVSVSASVDVLNTYMFRGIRQDDTKVIMWPAASLGFDAYSGDGALKGVSLSLGTWNSLHTGAAGQNGPSGKLWYEGDFFTTVGFDFGGMNLASTYTAYTSPNDTFSTVKEIAFNVAVDDSGALGPAALSPYALVAFELGAKPGLYQADGGLNGGTYLELGVAPGWEGSKIGLSFPVKVGMSLSDYYELDGVDNRFGFFSVAGLATVPLGSSSFGEWNVHGGLEFQRLGTTTRAFNGGDQNKVIALAGIGMSY